jgi:hypothetical protein
MVDPHVVDGAVEINPGAIPGWPSALRAGEREHVIAIVTELSGSMAVGL